MAEIGLGVESGSSVESGFTALLRERPAANFTENGFAAFLQSGLQNDYHFVTFLTKQSVAVKKVEYQPADENGNVKFTVTAMVTLPTGEGKSMMTDGTAVLKEGLIENLSVNGTILHELNKTGWSPADVPLYSNP